MIICKNCEEAKSKLIYKALNGFKCRSRFGIDVRAEPTFLVVKNLKEFEDLKHDLYTKVYYSRFEEAIEDSVKKLKSKPYTRRVSIPIWKPEDHLSRNPPAITEISFLVVDGKLNLTAYIRSLDCFNYFDLDVEFLSYALERMSKLTEFDIGDIAMIVGIPHVYERDVKSAKDLAEDFKEVYGYTDYGTHIVEDYISSAWHTALDIVYNYGKEKKTEWDFFEGQEKSLFVHRLFIEIRKPEENKLHSKAPITEKYCTDYAHEYVIYSGFDRPVDFVDKGSEEYTYAERARCGFDQLYECVRKLKENSCVRNCYVAISRLEDLKSENPPCLRGYQFLKLRDQLAGVFYMRSNDVYGAMHANIYAFALLTKYVSEFTGFKSYKYYHFAVDAHIYNESLEFVRDILYPKSPKFSDFIK